MESKKNNITEALHYYGSEKGIEAIIIDEKLIHEKILNDSDANNYIAEIKEKEAYQGNKTNISKKGISKKTILLLTLSLVFLVGGYLLYQYFSNNNEIKRKQEHEAQEKAKQDSIAAESAMEASMQATALLQDSANKIANFEISVPNNYKFLNEKEVDWRDGELIVPQNQFWRIETMLVYQTDEQSTKLISANLCEGKPEISSSNDFQTMRQTIKTNYVAMRINNTDFLYDEIAHAASIKDANQFSFTRYIIREFGFPPGTSICIPSPEKGGPPVYNTFEVSQYIDSNIIVSTLTNQESAEAFSDNFADSIREAKLKIISTYYTSLHNKNFDARYIFDNNVSQYITKYNTSPEGINSALDDHYKEFTNEHFELDPYSIFVAEDATGRVSYSGNYRCFRTSKQKYQTCTLHCEVIFNDQLKLTSYRETKIENLKFSDSGN
jgi:hypothetical protein